MKLNEVLDKNESMLAHLLERKFGTEPIYVVARFRSPFTLGRKLYVGQLNFKRDEKIEKEDLKRDGNVRYILKLSNLLDTVRETEHVFALVESFDKQYTLKRINGKLVLINRDPDEYYPEELEQALSRFDAPKKTQ